MGLSFRTQALPTQKRHSTSIEGRARVGRRTKELVERLKKGDIAVICHRDMDVLAARELVKRAPRAVINAETSLSGRYPAYGAMILMEANIPLLDEVGQEAMDAIPDGSPIMITGNQVRTPGGFEASGTWLSREIILERLVQAKTHIGEELGAFARNTLEYLDKEWQSFLEPLNLPELKTPIRGRHVVVVTRAPDYERDLRTLRPYLREVRPVIIAVDGAADRLMQMGYKPHVILGDMDSISERALRSKTERVVHGYTDPARLSPGWERCEQMKLETHLLRAPGTSEDLAMRLAYEMGAELIVAVGTHFSLEEFLDKGRHGMSSTFLTRLIVGTRLVDAKGISRMYAVRRIPRELYWLFLAALAPVAVALALSPTGQWLMRFMRSWWHSLFG
jgi:uncharacterized membrane-anchored protein